MKVVLIGKKIINSISLPSIIMGNYWLKINENKLINIEASNGKWKISNSDSYKIIDINSENINIYKNNYLEEYKIKDEAFIEEYSINLVYINMFKEYFILYAYPTYENSFSHFRIDEFKEILIGSGDKCDIQYNSKLVASEQARIFLYNGRWMIENLEKDFCIFVNQNPVNKTKRLLLNGDTVFIMGLRIIFIGKNIYINNPFNTVSYNESFESIEENFDVENNINDEDISDEDNIYTRSPRIITKITKENIKIDPPPQAQSKEKMPAILVMGSSMVMGLMSMMNLASALSKISETGQVNFGIVMQILMSVSMLIVMLVFPLLQRKYEDKLKVKYEKKRQERYGKYINKKIQEINEIATKQRNILSENYASVEECSNIILNNSTRLWERKIENYDFLSVRLGVGEIPLALDVQYPEKSFEMEDDNLVEMLNTIGRKSKVLKNAPIIFSFVQNNITGIISKDEETARIFLKNLVLQLITFQSFEDLKLVFFLSEENVKRLEYLKMLPHIWNNSKEIRFFTADYNEMRVIDLYLSEELHDRFMYEDLNYKKCKPYYLIITDCYRKIENLKIVGDLLKSKINIGASIICISDDLTTLPNECKSFINIEKNGKGIVFESEMVSNESNESNEFFFDFEERIVFDKILNKISNIIIKQKASSAKGLPNTYTFMQMYDAGTIEQLNIIDRWKRNDSTLSLRAPIGIDVTGSPIILDAHEKYHGPHGLIAGSTGSGKSEFIITYILSLAVNYHPYDVSFVLIDYKGGGLSGAFKKRDVILPHLLGTITNIDSGELRRSLNSIQSELRRRQIIFNQARDMTNEGTIDIYKYQKLYHEGVVKEPISHLFIISDEFAELKQQQPEFMNELISVARIGRSLGIHLVLATQKPAGIVNDQIRSNTKFAVCLKVQEKQDSIDVIKRPDAANLKNAGQFYMEVGNDEYFVLGQSAWSGAPYFPSDGVTKIEDTSIEFISGIGNVLKKVDDVAKKTISSEGEQLTRIVDYLYNVAVNENIEIRKLWLDSIPEVIYLYNLIEKYKVIPNDNLTAICGEYDDPQNQRQGLYELDLSKGGNVLIYGSADSGKETLISTIVYSIVTRYSSEKIWLYLLDFGSEALKIFKGIPHVGDIVVLSDNEKIDRFFTMMQNEIANRKEILSDYNGDYKLYNKTSGKILPVMTIIINNYEGFSEFYLDKYDDILLSITREGTKYGINFIMTAGAYSGVRYRLTQNFKQKIALRLNNDDDYFNIFDKVGKNRPSNLFGRGLVSINDSIYEFQTAKLFSPEDWNINIKKTIEILKIHNPIIAKPIPTMPKIIEFEHVKEAFKDITTVPIGISKNKLKICTYNYSKNLVNIIVSKNLDDLIGFIENLIIELNMLQDISLNIIDAEKIIKTKKGDFEESYSELMEKLQEDKGKRIISIIIGIDKFISQLENTETQWFDILKNTEQKKNCNFIIIEKSSRLKDHEYEPWYKAYIYGEDGIWLGNGIDSQYLIKISSNRQDIINNCGNNYGYIINQGEATLIRFIGTNEEGDENG